jgi:selenide, water dikinase
MFPAGSESIAGGCSRKIGEQDLDRILDPVRAASAQMNGRFIESRVDLPDACELELELETNRVVVSSDLIYDISTDKFISGYVAIIHAMSDLFASLAEPLWGTVTVAWKASEIRGSGAAESMAGIVEALASCGAVLAGGHSVRAEDPFVNAAVVGVGFPWVPSPPQHGDFVVLTKPIGTGIALSCAKQGIAQEQDIADEIRSMQSPNFVAAELLRQLIGELPGCVRGITDVSGFGFLSALRHLCPDAEVEISASAIPTFRSTADMLATGAHSGLLDQNRLASEPHVTYLMDRPEEAVASALLNDPQTSGGLLVVLDPISARRLETLGTPAGLAVSQVGTVTGQSGSELSRRLTIV